jgi:hypothetical protein
MTGGALWPASGSRESIDDGAVTAPPIRQIDYRIVVALLAGEDPVAESVAGDTMTEHHVGVLRVLKFAGIKPD